MDKQMDFSAIATKYNVKCSDGLTILKGSFAHQDGMTVPMVYQHNHSDINNVIGHCLLKEEEEGVRLYAYLNQDVEAGKKAKSLVQHGDIKAVSIYANGLQKDPSRTFVKHGNIKEVSIVLSPANPEAVIDFVALEHSDGTVDFSEEEGTIYNGDNIVEIFHSDEEKDEEVKEETKVEEVKEETKAEEVKEEIKLEDSKNEDENDQNIEHSDNKEQKEQKALVENLNKIKLSDDETNLLALLIAKTVEGEKSTDEEKKFLKEEFEKLPKDKQEYFTYMVGAYSEEKNKNQGGKDMGTVNHSVFDNQNENVLSHAEIKEIFDDARKNGSLKDAIIAHTTTYGVDGIENLFPDYKLVEDPATIKRDDSWVGVLMSGITKKPFAKIKSMAFNITATEARAKGYVKGNRKVEEIITALKRETSPQTIYKKQKLDRDDIIDITDFDIVAYLKKELKDMLQEELARAILIGDGRLADADDKIKEANIRPISSDDSAYTIRTIATIAANASNKDITDQVIEKLLRARKDYKGSGNLTFFCSPDYLTTMLLAQDSIGRRVYSNEQDLASALRVSRIVETPVLEGATYTNATTSKVYDIIGIAFSLKDYSIGADKKGEVAMFDDFDINYNQMVYLIETRCSGSLTKPYSALVVLKEQTVTSG